MGQGWVWSIVGLPKWLIMAWPDRQQRLSVRCCLHACRVLSGSMRITGTATFRRRTEWPARDAKDIGIAGAHLGPHLQQPPCCPMLPFGSVIQCCLLLPPDFNAHR